MFSKLAYGFELFINYIWEEVNGAPCVLVFAASEVLTLAISPCSFFISSCFLYPLNWSVWALFAIKGLNLDSYDAYQEKLS